MRAQRAHVHACLAPRAAQTQARRLNKAGGAIYFVQGITSRRIKIGFSTNILNRLEALGTSCPEQLRLLGAISGTMAAERALHARFASFRVKGEWFENRAELVAYIEIVMADPARMVLRDCWSDVAT